MNSEYQTPPPSRPSCDYARSPWSFYDFVYYYSRVPYTRDSLQCTGRLTNKSKTWGCRHLWLFRGIWTGWRRDKNLSGRLHVGWHCSMLCKKAMQRYRLTKSFEAWLNLWYWYVVLEKGFHALICIYYKSFDIRICSSRTGSFYASCINCLK